MRYIAILILALAVTGCSIPRLGGYVQATTGGLLSPYVDNGRKVSDDQHVEIEGALTYRLNSRTLAVGKLLHRSSIETSADGGVDYAGAGLRVEF